MLINSLFRFRGGEVQYTFVFEPEFLPATGSTTINGQYDDARKKVVKIYVVLLQIHLNFNTTPIFVICKVHFAEDTASNDTASIENGDGLSKKPYPGQLLQLSPTEEIVFRREDGETTGLLTMNNSANSNVAYKVIFIYINKLQF